MEKEVTSPSKYTIQVVLRDILTQHVLEDQVPFQKSALQSLAGPEAIQAAITIVAMIPILAIYPLSTEVFHARHHDRLRERMRRTPCR